MRHAVSFLFCLSLAAPAMAGGQTLVLDSAHTKVTFFLEATGHDVDGLFELESGSIQFDEEAGTASGEIALLASSGTTYKKKRDKTMHAKVLESAIFPRISFIPDHFEGHLKDGEESQVQLEGQVELLGVEHPLTLPATVKLAGDDLHLKTVFTVPYIDWGLEDPSLLFLRVGKTVELTVEADGRVSALGAQASR